MPILQKRRYRQNHAGLYVPAPGGGLGLQTSLSAFFQFETTSWTDELGVNNLTGSNSPTVVAGAVGNAVKFTSGSSMSLTHANATALTLGGGTFSFQLWVNLVSGLALSAGELSLMSKNDGGFGNLDYGVGTDFTTSNVWSWVFYNSSSSAAVCNSSVTVASGLHHIMGTWDGTTQKIYVDAGTAATNTPGITPNAGSSTFTIGRNGNGGAYASVSQDVLIDQVGLWKGRVLNSADAALLYNSGAGLTYAAMA